MELNELEKELLINYIPTLKRYFKKNINFHFFKNPFIEKFILKLSIIDCDNKLISNIVDKINNNIISNEDIYFCINYYYQFGKENKKKIQHFLFNNDDVINLKLKINIVLFTVKFYQYCFFINELLYNNINNINNELFYSIYLYLKSNDFNENSTENININKYSKKYFNMKLFFYLIDDLFKIYKKNLEILIKNEIIDTLNIHLLFTNNIFGKWYVIYKKYIEENNFEEIEQNYKLKHKSLKNFICNRNIC